MPALRDPDLRAAAALVAATLLAYLPLWQNGFVAFDDPAYASHNAMVLDGLSLRGVAWAFTTNHAANWHPLTWLSLMLDAQLFGAHAAGYHATNLGLHVCNVLLAFYGLRWAQAPRWPSALAAALFAVHPLRVESVAWVAERKDVLCAFFYLLALVAWGGFARGLRWGWGAALASCALALLAKPMAVSLPLALWIVDAWPLRRAVPLRQRLRETLPFFALAAASCAVTLGVQLSSGGTEAWMRPPLWARLAFTPVAYLRYLELTLWPSGLAVLYPHPGASLGASEVLAGVAVLAAISALAIRTRHARQWLAAGWVWFLVTLVPVIGLVHVGFQGIADRYTYLPSLGLSVALGFGAAEFLERLRVPAPARAALALAPLVALALATTRQLGFWRDGIRLYERALAVTADNFAIHVFLANELADAGRRADAIAHFREALRIRPDFPHAHYGLGVTLEEQGQPGAAMEEYRAALDANPDFAEAHFNLANLLGRSGRLGEAADHYRRVLELQPDNAAAKQGLALAERLLRSDQN